MIIGAHVLLYSNDPAADRAFLRDILGFKGVDAGEGWSIFALPPAEVAVHPANGVSPCLHGGQPLLAAVLYFMCEDVRAAVEWLAARKVSCSELVEEPWGIKTTIRLPSGGEIGLYQPTHPTPLDLARK